MKKFTLLLIVLAICLPAYSKVLVYSSNMSVTGASIDAGDPNAVLGAGAAKSYLVLDVNDDTNTVIDRAAWIPFNKRDKIFVVNSTITNNDVQIQTGVKSNVWIWDFNSQDSFAEVAALDIISARFVGKTSLVKYGATSLGQIPRSMKGAAVLDSVDPGQDDDEFYGIGTPKVSLDNAFTKRANDPADKNAIGTAPRNFVAVVNAIKASLAAKLEPVGECTLTINTVGSGTVTIDPNQATYQYGDVVTLTATPDTGYVLVGFTGDATTATVTITGNMTITATFAELPTFTITASAGANGSLDPNGTFTKFSGQSQLFTATPDTGYVVDTWSVDSNVVQTGGTTYTLSNITADHAVTVSFKTATFAVTATADANGVLDPNGTLTKNYGSNQLFTATPNTGYAVDTWFVDDVNVQTGGTTYTLSSITAAHTLNVTFKTATFTITATAGANGDLDPNGAITKSYGSSQLFTATPDTDYEVDTWSVDDVVVQTGGTTYTLTDIQAAHTVDVAFKAAP
jgi:hypothetical protein